MIFSIKKNAFALFFLINIFVIPACQDDEVMSPPPPEPECQDTVLINNVIITPHAENTLRMNVTFETSENVDTYINYWLTDDSDKTKSSILSSNSNTHQITLINMLAESDYIFQIVAVVDSCEYLSETYNFITEALPPEVFVPTPQNLSLDFDGYILTHSGLPGVVFAMDSRGRVVWYEVFDEIVRLHTVSEKNTLAVLLGPLDYLEMDFFGKELRRYQYTVDYDDLIHHELQQNEAGDMLTLGTVSRNYDLSSVGGSTDEQVVSDDIIQFAPDGTEKWRWSLLDHANPLDDSDILTTRTDWTHCNALAFDTDGNVLLSVRNFNQIWKVNIQDGSVMWRLGINGDFTMDTDDYFYMQHAVRLMPDGDLMLYDNGGVRETSRALVFDIDEANMTATTNLKIELPEDFYSNIQSNCMMIGEDKVLFAKRFLLLIYQGHFFGM